MTFKNGLEALKSCDKDIFSNIGIHLLMEIFCTLPVLTAEPGALYIGKY